MENGFAEKDRKALLVVCSFFLVIVFLCWGNMFWKHVNRERQLTLENYHDYVSVYVDRSTSNKHELEYYLVVESKKDISNFEMVVDVQLEPIMGGTQRVQSFKIERNKLFDDIEVKQFIMKETTSVFDYSINVISISGRL